MREAGGLKEPPAASGRSPLALLLIGSFMLAQPLGLVKPYLFEGTQDAVVGVEVHEVKLEGAALLVTVSQGYHEIGHVGGDSRGVRREDRGEQIQILPR